VIGSDAVQVKTVMTAAERVQSGHRKASSALERAPLELTGQITGPSVAELAGERQRNKIPLSFSTANPELVQQPAKRHERDALGTPPTPETPERYRRETPARSSSRFAHQSARISNHNRVGWPFTMYRAAL
jgi:L-alanine-DL-glutamate epimerase-like enolase superfamily enzyme